MAKFNTTFYCALLGVIFSLLVAPQGVAQDASEVSEAEDAGLNPELVLKMGGMNPAVGAAISAADKTRLRVLGYFNTNFDETGFSNRYFLDISYLRSNYWIIDRSAETYWGINLNVAFRNPVIAPGALAGVRYELNEEISVFGEVGLNLFFHNSTSSTYLGMGNTGLGMKIAL